MGWCHWNFFFSRTTEPKKLIYMKASWRSAYSSLYKL
jgi:hypothetical protein